MKFLLGSRNLIVMDRFGIRRHKAPKDHHFEVKNLRGTPAHVLKPDAIKESLEDMTQSVAHAVADKAVNDALLFHADRTEDLLKRVLRAKNSSEAAELVATEIKVTEERMQERQEATKI